MKGVSSWKYSGKKGFTLIETLLAISLFLIILSVIFVVMQAATNSVDTMYRKERNLSENYYVLEFLRDDIAKAQGYFLTPKSDMSIVLVHRESSKKYRYIYYAKKDQALVRKTYTENQFKKVFREQTEGNNYMLNHVLDFTAKIDGRLLEITLTKTDGQTLHRNYLIRAEIYEKK